MPRLNHNEVADAVAEDHICQGCDRDRMDCVCGEYYDDSVSSYDERDMYIPDINQIENEDRGDPYGLLQDTYWDDRI